jgi:hypothetical protein
LEHPNQDYENKEMICKLNTSLGFEQIYEQNGEICSGDLWDFELSQIGKDPFALGLGEDCFADISCEEGLACDEELKVCVVDEDYVGDQCPEGTYYDGAVYDDEIPYPVCRDSNFECVGSCDNCFSGEFTKLWDVDFDTGETIETCVECFFFDSDCKVGFICENQICIVE